MIFITHILFGLLICVIFKIPLDFGIVLGSTMPDVDYPYSYVGSMFVPFSDYFYKKFGHRTLFHGIYWSLLLGILSFVETKFLTLFIGYTSHILLDLFTYTGVKLLYPLNVSFTLFDGPIQTGKKQDKILAVVFGILSIIIFFYLNFLLIELKNF